jgi:hypothetical protein
VFVIEVAIRNPGRPRVLTDRAVGSLPVAGMLLTAGSSGRMGVDKASIVIGGRACAETVGSRLSAVADPSIEVGPGRSGLNAFADEAPRFRSLGRHGLGRRCGPPRRMNAGLPTSTRPKTLPVRRDLSVTDSRRRSNCSVRPWEGRLYKCVIT